MGFKNGYHGKMCESAKTTDGKTALRKKGDDMPRKKGQTQYKKGAKNFNNDSLDFGKNTIEKDPELKIRRYDVDADDIAQTAADLAAGKINQEMERAKEELERRKKISASNRATRAEGRMFEESILRACEVYKANGTAVINKVPEPRRVVGRTGGRSSLMICCNEKKSDPDFEGSLAPDGKCIIFDAKHTDKDRILSIALTDHQREILDIHYACGSDCYVCVSFGFKKYYMIPYSVWRDMKEIFGRQYILPEDEQIQGYLIPFDLTVDKNGNNIYTVWFLGKPDVIPDAAQRGGVAPSEETE